MSSATPAAIRAGETPPRTRVSGYPSEFLARVAGRDKRPLGDPFGLSTFGVNLTRLAPGAWSALHHRHGRSDEFIYVLEGTPTLFTDAGETLLAPGMCAGFPSGGTAHHLEESQRGGRGDPGDRRSPGGRLGGVSGRRSGGGAGAGRDLAVYAQGRFGGVREECPPSPTLPRFAGEGG